MSQILWVRRCVGGWLVASASACTLSMGIGASAAAQAPLANPGPAAPEIRSVQRVVEMPADPIEESSQDPFSFHDLWRLEQHIRAAARFDASDPRRSVPHYGPSLTNPFLVDDEAPATYADQRLLRSLLEETDALDDRGHVEEALKRYRHAIDMVRRNGNEDNTLALLLDHLAERLLAFGDRVKAEAAFQEALSVRQKTLAGADDAPCPQPLTPECIARMGAQMHEAELRVRIAQLAVARGDLGRAQELLAQARATDERPDFVRFENRLDAVYLSSRLLERVGRWDEAFRLWQDAAGRRDKTGEPRVDVMKEWAAFEARRGDIAAAAKIAQGIPTPDPGKRFRHAARVPLWIDSRVAGDGWSLYESDSDIAMKEILAIDRWQRDGPAAGAAALPEPFTQFNRFYRDGGTGPEQLRMLQWLTHRVYLHLSVLLDDPTPENTQRAYELIANVRGIFIDRGARMAMELQTEVDNPNVQDHRLEGMRELATVRRRRAGLEVAQRLDGGGADPDELASLERQESALVATLSTIHAGYTANADAASIERAVPAGTAMIELVAWDRRSRANPGLPQRSYGAFVLRNDRPVVYVDLGAAAPIDRLVAQAGRAAIAREDPSASLRALYDAVLNPLEPALGDARRLIVVPDGNLAEAPLSALIDPQGRYQIERRSLVYVNSWREVLTNLAWYPPQSMPSVVVGAPDFEAPQGSHGTAALSRGRLPPLRFAAQEAEVAAATLRVWPDHYLAGARARKEIVESFESPKVLHLATHGLTLAAPPLPDGSARALRLVAHETIELEFPPPAAIDDPLLGAAIALAGADLTGSADSTGLLTGLEIASMNLAGTKLAVLSTCESGRGKPMEGQGVIGLRSAFAMAGARAVLMSLWPIDDEGGTQFMKRFYAHYSQGPEEALRQAQLETIATLRENAKGGTASDASSVAAWAGYAVSERQFNESPLPARKAAGDVIGSACWRVHGMDAKGLAAESTISVGGLGVRMPSSAGEVTYDIHLPGNEIEAHFDEHLPSGQVLRFPDEFKASQWKTWTLTLQHDATTSSLRIAVDGEVPRFLLELGGGPNLFPSLEIPRAPPPLSAYSRIRYSVRGNEQKLEQIEACDDQSAARSTTRTHSAPATSHR